MSRRSRTIYVMLSCNKEHIDERDVDYIDCWEDFQGRDILKFRCPVCGADHVSLRFG